MTSTEIRAIAQVVNGSFLNKLNSNQCVHLNRQEDGENHREKGRGEKCLMQKKKKINFLVENCGIKICNLQTVRFPSILAKENKPKKGTVHNSNVFHVMVLMYDHIPSPEDPNVMPL